jgi:hypothetical protein
MQKCTLLYNNLQYKVEQSNKNVVSPKNPEYGRIGSCSLQNFVQKACGHWYVFEVGRSTFLNESKQMLCESTIMTKESHLGMLMDKSHNSLVS